MQSALNGNARRREAGEESVVKEIMVGEKIPNLVKGSNLHIQEAL